MIQLKNIEFERSDNSILAKKEQRTFGDKIPEPQIKMSKIAIALNQNYEREPIEANGYRTAGACSSGLRQGPAATYSEVGSEKMLSRNVSWRYGRFGQGIRKKVGQAGYGFGRSAMSDMERYRRAGKGQAAACPRFQIY